MNILASSNLTVPILLSPSLTLSTSAPTLTPTVTPLNIFTALIPLILSCVLHPLGSACSLPSHYSFLLRISPITNLLDALDLLWELNTALSNRHSARTVFESRYRPTIDYRPRALLSAITVMQFLKLNSYTGMWYTFLICEIYFYSWAAQEVVFLACYLCWPSPPRDQRLAYLGERSSAILTNTGIVWFILHLVCPWAAVVAIYLDDVAIDNSVAQWYWYVAIEVPWNLWYGAIMVQMAGLMSDSLWRVVGWLWWFVMLFPVLAWILGCMLWMMMGVLGPGVAGYLCWRAVGERYTARMRAGTLVVRRRFRNWEWGVGLAVVGFGRMWSLGVFEPEETGKVGWFASWP